MSLILTCLRLLAEKEFMASCGYAFLPALLSFYRHLSLSPGMDGEDVFLISHPML